jgi:multiple sugar transport system permease protein
MKRVLQIILLVVVFALMAYPLMWMVGISLRTGEGTSMRYYTEVWQSGPFDRYFLNSLIVVTVVLIGNILICSMAGYAFARYKIPGGKFLFFLVISMIMLPKQVILVPLYILMQKLHLLDTYWALTVPFMADPFNIFLIRQFLVTLPQAGVGRGRDPHLPYQLEFVFVSFYTDEHDVDAYAARWARAALSGGPQR